MAKQRKTDAFLLIDMLVVLFCVVLCSGFFFNYHIDLRQQLHHEITYHQAKSMAELETNCIRSICFNGNGNINQAQTVENCVYQLGFGRFYCE